MELNKIYHKNRGVRPLFSENITIDFYDGLTSGVCKLDTTESWLACNICYFDPGKYERIFTLISIEDVLVAQFNALKGMPYRGVYNKQIEKEYQSMKQLIRKCFNIYNGKVFLMKCRNIDDVEYEIVEIPTAGMRYFDDFEDALDQPEQDKEKWLSFFESQKTNSF